MRGLLYSDWVGFLKEEQRDQVCLLAIMKEDINKFAVSSILSITICTSVIHLTPLLFDPASKPAKVHVYGNLV